MMTKQLNVNLLFIILVCLYLLPIWSFEYFPTQDGPAHVYNAYLIKVFDLPEFSSFHEYYRLNDAINPTWLGHYMLVFLMDFFDPFTSEKVLVTFYVIIFLLSMMYALRVINPEASFLIFLMFPFVYCYILDMGFYACSISNAFAFFCIGYWLRHEGKWNIRSLIVMSILGFILYSYHIVIFGMTVGVLGVFTLWELFKDIFIDKTALRPTLTESLKQRIFLPFLTLLPSIISAALFVGSKERVFDSWRTITWRIKALVKSDYVASFQLLDIYNLGILFTTLILAIVVFFLTKKFKRNLIENADKFIMASIACVVVFLLVPEMRLVSANGMEGGGYILNRINAFPFYMLILWLASQQFSLKAKNVVISLGIAVSLIMLGMNMYKISEINPQLDEYVGVYEHIEPKSTVFPISVAHGGYNETTGGSLTQRANPFLHALNYVSTKQQLINLGNYEATQGYFPFAYLDEINPALKIGYRDMLNMPIKFDDYSERTPGRIDYLIVWLGKKRNQDSDYTAKVYQQIEGNFEQVFVSKNGLLELYKNIR